MTMLAGRNDAANGDHLDVVRVGRVDVGTCMWCARDFYKLHVDLAVATK